MSNWAGKERPICGAKTRTGEPCKKTAGQGTPFFGKEGYRCSNHGGLSPKAMTAADETTARGLTFDTLDQALAKRIEDFANDPNILDLKREIGLCRAQLENLATSGDKAIETAAIVSSLSSTIGRLVVRVHKMEMDRQGLVQVSLVRILIDSWRRAILETLPDADVRNMLIARMLDLSKSKMAVILSGDVRRQGVITKNSTDSVVAKGLTTGEGNNFTSPDGS
jgi:hypothetical protein